VLVKQNAAVLVFAERLLATTNIGSGAAVTTGTTLSTSAPFHLLAAAVPHPDLRPLYPLRSKPRNDHLHPCHLERSYLNPRIKVSAAHKPKGASLFVLARGVRINSFRYNVANSYCLRTQNPRILGRPPGDGINLALLNLDQPSAHDSLLLCVPETFAWYVAL
jgi:hypothetical protein